MNANIKHDDYLEHLWQDQSPKSASKVGIVLVWIVAAAIVIAAAAYFARGYFGY